MPRKRTNMNVDMERVAEVAEYLGTKGTTATVHAALDEVLKLKLRRELAAAEMPWLNVELLEEMRRDEDDLPNIDLSDFGE
jgi:Arc/MetJ family transcription regulator